MTDAFLGIDIGTRSTKGVVLIDGSVVGEAHVGHDVSNPVPQQFEHDAESIWWGGVVAVTRLVLAALPKDVRIVAVGLSACGPCVVPVDEAGRPLRPAILYGVDTRSTREVAALQDGIGRDVVQARFGMPLTSQTVGPKIDWIVANEPDVYERTRAFASTNGFVGLRLTGVLGLDRHQAAYWAPYFRDGGWDASYDTADVVKKLPELFWSTDVVGHVTAPAAEQTGLPRGIPVVIGSSDGMTSAYGTGTSEASQAVLNYGSTLGATVFTGRSTATGGVWRTPGAVAGQDCLVAGMSTGGALAKWFLEQFARELLQAGDSSSAFLQLAAEAESSPAGARGLLLLPYFAGERTPFYDPGAAGVVLGLRLDHTRGDHYRALLEGTAFGVRHILDEMARMEADVESLRATGGGTATALWLQIVSNVTGLSQEVVAPPYGSASGAAFLAAIGAGPLDGLADIAARVPVCRVVRPDAQVSKTYQRLFATYLALYTQTRDLLTELGAEPRP
ncbi:MAG TPA: FGGY family carbohydrate kinase [Acidothermaceae bacterium]